MIQWIKILCPLRENSFHNLPLPVGPEMDPPMYLALKANIYNGSFGDGSDGGVGGVGAGVGDDAIK